MKLFGKLEKHPGGHGYGVVANALTTVEYAAGSYAFGYLQNAYPGKARVFGVPVDLAAGVAMKAVSLGLTFAGKGGALRPHLDAFGNAGLGAYFHTLGSGHGFAKSGRVRAIVPATSVAKLKAAVPETTVFGVSAKAPQGDLLSADDLARLASR